MTSRSVFFALLLLAGGIPLQAQYELVNSSLQLGGSSYISVPYDDALNYDIVSSGAISIDAWVRPTKSGTSMTIVGNDESQGYWFGITAQGKLRFAPNPSTAFENTSTIPLNTWTHVGVTFDAFKNDMKFYVNGTLNRQVNTGQTYMGFSYFDLRIGADRNKAGPALYWTGGLDEVRIWSAVIDFASAAGRLYRIPHAMTGGRYGYALKGGWRFNGNAQSVDGNVNGSPVGTVSYVQTPDPPLYGRIALVVSNAPDRTDHLTIPHRSALTLTQDLTLECWVRPASGGNASYHTFISKGSYSQSRWNYWLGLNKNNGRIRFLPTGDWKNPLESSNALALNTWTHVAARFERVGASFRATLFVNGVPAGNAAYAQGGSGNSDALTIGASDTRSSGHQAYGYSGAIDEVRIWNVARSDDQIADHHRVEFSGGQSGMIARYPMHGDDIDRSGNGYHGTANFRGSSEAYFIDASSLPGAPTLTLSRPLGGERWQIGDLETIVWNASGLVNVTVELSRDGGKTFGEVLAASVPAGSGKTDWTVTAPPTSDAVIRVRPPSTTALSAESHPFQIEDPVPILDVTPRQLDFTSSVSAPPPPPQFVNLRNVGGKTLSWTADRRMAVWYEVSPTSGTANIDSFKVEITDPTLPVGVYFDDIIIGGTAVNAGLQVRVVYNVIPEISYTVSGAVRDGAGAPAEGVKMTVVGPVTKHAFTNAKGEYAVTGLIPGDYAIAPTSPYFSFTPQSSSLLGLNADQTDVDFEAARLSGDVVIRYEEGWNLVSLPLPLSPARVEELFTHAEGNAYQYTPGEGYVETEELSFGTGYWIKFSRKDSIVVTGSFATSMEITLQDEYGGWNLIGAPSGPVPLSGIEDDPTGALLEIYDYHPSEGYRPPPDGVLRPGRGYFAKVNVKAVARFIVQSFAPGGLLILEESLLHSGAGARPMPPPPPAIE